MQGWRGGNLENPSGERQQDEMTCDQIYDYTWEMSMSMSMSIDISTEVFAWHGMTCIAKKKGK